MPRLKSAKQERFCREYLKDLNASAAFIRAGYAKKAANVNSARLMAKDNIKKRLAELQAPIEKNIEDDATRLRDDLRMMSRVRYDDIFDANNKLRPHDELSDGAMLLLQGAEWKDGELVKLKIYDKLKSMDMLGRHFAVSAWEENINLHDVDDRVARIRRAQERAGLRSGKRVNGK